MKNPLHKMAAIWLALLAAWIAPVAVAQTETISVERAQYFNQTGAATVSQQTMPFTFAFYIRAATAGWGPKFYKPGSGGIPQDGSSTATNTGTLNFPTNPNNGTGYYFAHDFANNTDLQAFYPIAPTGGGQYGVLFTGGSAPSTNTFTDGLIFAADATYPSVIPQITSANNGATWTGGTLRLSPTGVTTIALNTFPEYSSTPYGSLIGVGIYTTNSSDGGVVGEASLESYYLPLGDSTETPTPVNQPAVTQLSLDGDWLEQGVNYKLELQYSVIASRPEEAILNSREFQGLATYRRITTVNLFVPMTPPQITSHPVTRKIGVNRVVEMSVEALGGKLSYQWRKNGVPLTESSKFIGTKLPTLTIVGTAESDAGNYDVVVTNTLGTVTSSLAALNVVVYPPVADFNRDGRPDIVLQNTSTGQRALWIMNGSAAPASVVDMGTIPAAWSMAAIADFNKDGRPDIVLQNTTTGERQLRLMTGTDVSAATIVDLGWVDIAWSIAGAADYNTDGNIDLYWQNSATGQRALWLLNGTTYAALNIVSLGWVDTNWVMTGMADFNGDANIDILWQNTATGQRALWLMNGGDFTPTNIVSLGWVDTNWSMAGITDFNTDGNVDILWQNTATGQRALWIMNGGDFSPTNIVDLGTVPTAWRIVR